MARRRRSKPARPVVAIGDGGVELHLGDPERQLLQSLLGQVRVLIRSELTGPLDESSMIRRLFPTAYAQDPDREMAYQAVSRDELVESKLAGVDLVEDTLDSAALDAEQAEGWLRTLNDVRLILGTRLDVSEDTSMVDPEHPEAALYVAYDYLGFLVDSLVEALAGSLPPPEDD